MQRVEAELSGSRTARGVRRAAAAVGAACLLAACAGSDAASTTSSVPVSEPSTSVEEPDTTTSTSTTTATTTSTTSTTVPVPVVDTVAPPVDSESDTTVAGEPLPDPVPVNTIFDPGTPEGEVEQATLSDLISFKDCLSQLPNCDAQAATRFALIDYAAGNIELINGWNADGLEIRNVDSWVFVVERVEFNDDGTEAIVYTCSTDQSRLVAPATAAASEAVIVAVDESSHSKYLVRRIDDRWVVTAKDTIESVEGVVGGYCE